MGAVERDAFVVEVVVDEALCPEPIELATC